MIKSPTLLKGHTDCCIQIRRSRGRRASRSEATVDEGKVTQAETREVEPGVAVHRWLVDMC